MLEEDDDEVQADEQPEGRAEATAAPAGGGSFLETVQNQVPGQLQGLGGAMEKSEMVVGTFQARTTRHVSEEN